MRVLVMVVVGAFLLSGCASEPAASGLATSMDDADGDGFIDAVEFKYGTDPYNATSVPDVMKHHDISFSATLANVVGTGVPSVQCPADQVNTQTVVWTIVAPEGNITAVHAAQLVFTITSAATLNDVDLFVYGPEMVLLGSGTGSSAEETVSLNGHHPIGDYTIEARGCSGVGNVAIEATGMVGWIPSMAELMAAGMHADDGHQH